MKVQYGEWGLANNYGEVIELNVGLKDNPELHNKILKHELKHEAGPFTIKDFKHDMTDRSVNIFSLMFFMFKHPKSLTQLLPFYKHKEFGWVGDISLCLLYTFLIIIIGVGIFLGVTS
jgi:hypothetical protein